MTIINWLINNKRIAIDAILCACAALFLGYGIIMHNQNKKLSESLEMANNNIEAYQGVISASQQANNVLKLQMADLKQYNDEAINKLDSVREEYKINAKDLNTAATQTQTIDVNKSKGVGGQIVVVNDTIYKDSIQYNDLTKVFYTIGKDSVNIRLDFKNTQYLYIYKKKEYKNKKNFFQRLFTLDFKKVTRYKYRIINTNNLIKEDSVRVIEQS